MAFLLSCTHCGNRSSRVRACCPFGNKICDSCRMDPNGPHANHPRRYKLVPMKVDD